MEQAHSGIHYDDKSLWLGNDRVQLISGAFHYFRVPRAEWRDRLEKCKHGGLNTIETIVPWNIHEHHEASYDWSENRDLGAFLDLVHNLGLFAIVRPSPYICGEWDNGGFPSWLSLKANVAYRRSNSVFLAHVERWYDELIPLVASRQWNQGGSVILVQIENEYGYFQDAQDVSYMEFLRDVMVERGIVVPLLTCDWPGKGFLVDGAVKGANFGSDFRQGLSVLREEQPDAFAFVSELWLAWFDHWGGTHNLRTGRQVANALKQVLSAGGHYNFYMWAGGTNFGYYAGRTTTGRYGAFITTSYDYDAPIGETGYLSEKYYECRLVNWLASTLSDVFAASEEMPSDWQVSNSEVELYGRQSPKGQALYLINRSDQSRRVRVTNPDGTLWPTSHELQLAPLDTVILLANCRLNDKVLLNQCSGEVLAYIANSNRPALLVYGDEGQPCEINLTIGERVHDLKERFPTGNRESVFALPGIDIVLLNRSLAYVTWIYKIGDEWAWSVDPSYGQRESVPLPTPESLQWHQADLMLALQHRPAATSPTLMSLEHFGVFQGYGWYRTAFHHEGGDTELVLTDVHDRALVFLNGIPQGVVGSFASFACLPIHTSPGKNDLLILVDALGRYTFTARVGEQKGLMGAAYIGGLLENLQAWEPSSISSNRWEIPIPWCSGKGLLLRLMGKKNHPLQFGIDNTLLHAHRSIGDDDEFIEVDVTPFLRPEGNTLWLQCPNDVTDLPSLVAVRFDVMRQLHGPWQVYGGVAGEDSQVTIDTAPFDELKWAPIESDGMGNQASRPTMFESRFPLPAISEHARPIKVLMDSMSKGTVWLNGHHLGRYWNHGPQQALYIPREWLCTENTMVVFDENGHSPDRIRLILEERFL